MAPRLRLYHTDGHKINTLGQRILDLTQGWGGARETPTIYDDGEVFWLGTDGGE